WPTAEGARTLGSSSARAARRRRWRQTRHRGGALAARARAGPRKMGWGDVDVSWMRAPRRLAVTILGASSLKSLKPSLVVVPPVPRRTRAAARGQAVRGGHCAAAHGLTARAYRPDDSLRRRPRFGQHETALVTTFPVRSRRAGTREDGAKCGEGQPYASRR